MNKKKLVWIIIALLFVILLGAGILVFSRKNKLDAQLDQADMLLADEKYEEAEASYEKALEIYPSSADAYLGIAESLIGQDKYDEALQTLDRGIDRMGSKSLQESKDNLTDQAYTSYVLNEYVVDIMEESTCQMAVLNKGRDMGFETLWSIDDTAVASIDDDGLVTGLAEGTTVIRASVGNDIWGYRDLTAFLTVGKLTTYFEDKGCKYVSGDKKLFAPAYLYQEDGGGLGYEGTLEIDQPQAEYSIDECNVSDPDQDGNVTLNITYTIKIPLKFGIIDDSAEDKDNWYYNWSVAHLVLCDDFTGQILEETSLYGVEGMQYDSQVTWNDMTYHITGTRLEEWEEDEDWTTDYDIEEGITWASREAVGTNTLTITFPKEYEGLVLVLNGDGITDYKDPGTDPKAAEVIRVEELLDK